MLFLLTFKIAPSPGKTIGFSFETHLILHNMKKYRITYKEVGKPKPGSIYYSGNKTEAQVIEFFGLDEPGVEWYKVELIN